MIKALLFIFGLTFSISATAENVVDIYGTEKNQSEDILKKYSKEIAEIQSDYLKEISLNLNGKDNDESIAKITKNKTLLAEKIKKEEGFLFVDFQTVIYPNYKNIYTTIEVIKDEQPDRMRFISREVITKNNGKISKIKADLIEKMIDYEDISFKLIRDDQLNLKNQLCPVYHCISGFNHSKLKPYLKIFNSGAIKEKKLILDTLNHDPNPERRAASAFLIGHFNDPKEIISLLLPHVNDGNNGVRNNVMRVIAATMSKANINQINAMPFLDLLNSPYTTDRNKALCVLYKAVESRDSKNLVIQKGGDRLLALLRLKQPNNHDIAYLILKKISDKDLGETNILAWEQWLSLAKSHIPE